jgi:FtsP/CotA-like multicopper oxidase with cupredoxin domain
VTQPSLIVFAVLTLAGAMRADTASAAPASVASSLDSQLASVRDENPDPHIVEVHLTARIANVEFAPGESIDAWTYNGVLPGPLIRARVGDRLIVHFRNELPRPTTVHWHGVRVPFAMDGVPEHSQPEVPTGGQFDYDFILPDSGLFWYHPHVMSAAQVGLGLYGALLVDGDEAVRANNERVLVLSDIAIDKPGVFEDPNSGGSAGMAFGRDGNRLLVNGRERPNITVAPGSTERWRIVNAAKSRYFEIDLGGVSITTIGVDGGLQEYPISSDTLVIAPGERKDVLVALPGSAGSSLTVTSRLYNRGYGSVEERLPFEDLFTVKFAGEPVTLPAGDRQLPARQIAPLEPTGATHVMVNLTIDQLPDRSFQYGINGVPFQKGHWFHATTGETQVWTITNRTKWSHPFHLHGFFFQVLDDHERPVHPLAWKDTIDVPFEQTVQIIVHFDDRPGMWMIHCHILDHADGGLMGMVDVSRPTGVPKPTDADADGPH